MFPLGDQAMQGEFDPAGLTALVIDENAYSRAISIDQLRSMGFRSALGAPDPRAAWDIVLLSAPSATASMQNSSIRQSR